MQDISRKILEDLNRVDFKQELILGSCAGFAICLIGHPFDTIKTRMQTSNRSMIETVRSTINKEGLLAVYKGMASPLISTPMINAVVFTSYEVSKVILKKNTNLSEMNTIALAGSIAGFFNSFIAGPVELFKTKLQVQCQEKYYKSYTDIAIKLYRVSGVRGWFQGTSATILRDTISIGAQFWTYEFVLEYIKKRFQTEDNKKRVWPFLISGSAAGVMCWASSYPIDVAKSRIQARILDKKISYYCDGNLKAEILSVYSKFGFRGLFAGIVPIMGRAAFANAAGFWTWEYAKMSIRGSDN